ncbi:MAG: hypothetical protein ACF8GE_01530 [Phycisphaerales bacterium JB043]
MYRRDRAESTESLRSDTDPEIRLSTPYHFIDPGFINLRKCFSVFGEPYINFYNEHAKKDGDWQDDLRNNHIAVEAALQICSAAKVPVLGELANTPRVGVIFCSTERLEGAPDVYEEGIERVRNKVLLDAETDRTIWLDYGIEHFVASTGRSEQSHESYVSIIGQVRSVSDDALIIHPLIMGAPTFDHWRNSGIPHSLAWYGFDLYQIFPEDIDQFSRIKTIDRESCNDWEETMKELSENFVKEQLATILGDETSRDWGGEQADHYSTSISIGGRRVSAAFLLKGPSKFREMTLEICGKRADQIVRLSKTNADLLIVQHSHDVGIAVRDTLRAFAVQPSNPRRYCIIDGRDTFRILKSYGNLP